MRADSATSPPTRAGPLGALLGVLLLLSAPTASAGESETPPSRAGWPAPSLVARGGLQLEMASEGNVWAGFEGTFGARWLGLVETTLEGSALFVTREETRTQRCTRRGCDVAAARFVLLASFGPRLVLARPTRRVDLTLTPSMAFGLVAQRALGAREVAEEEGPGRSSMSFAPAPGLAIGVGPLALALRLRPGPGGRGAATWSLQLGATFL